jgi:hypothetical protein
LPQNSQPGWLYTVIFFVIEFFSFLVRHSHAPALLGQYDRPSPHDR